MLQTNNNSDTFFLFISELVKQLNVDRPGWRDNTILQLYGAKCHTTPAVRALLERLQINALVSAPYSHDNAVCELFFAMFKRGEINLKKYAVSKSKYSIKILIFLQSSLAIL